MNTRLPFKACIFISMAILPFSLTAQNFSLQSISPANGETNLSPISQFSFTFTQPLAKSAEFISDLSQLPVQFELHPNTTELDNANATFSDDNKTLILNNISLKPNTQYSLLITGALSADSAKLPQPASVTFTTGASLATGTITGTVTSPSINIPGTIVAAFQGSAFREDLYAGFGLVQANGSYEIKNLPAGKYDLLALKDEDKSGDFNPEQGDPLGGYDPDHNKLLDQITLSEGEAKSNLNIEIKTSSPKTARELFSLVEPFANAVGKASFASPSGNASLIAIIASGLNTTGKSPMWFYAFHLGTQDTLIAFTATDHLIVSGFPISDEETGFLSDTSKTPLPDNWLDSDAAMAIALENGGSDFLVDHQNANILGFGAYIDTDTLFAIAGGNNAGRGFAKPAKTKRKGFFPIISKQSISLRFRPLGVQGIQPLWLFFFGNSDAPSTFFSFYVVAVNMVSGDPLILFPLYSYALANLQAARTAIADSASDAKLVGIEANPYVSQLLPDGRALFWHYIFWSASANVYYLLMASNHLVWDISTMDQFDSQKELPSTFVNSDVAVPKAEAKGGTEFRNRYPNGFTRALLSYGLYPQDPSRLVWHIQYSDFSLSEDQWVNVFIDGETGDVIVGVNGSEPSSPATFALQPVYPNPTQEKYSLNLPLQLREPARVEIKIYNVLGQEVKRIYSGKKAAGVFTLKFPAATKGLSTGVYFIRAKIFAQSGKIHILTRPFYKK